MKYFRLISSTINNMVIFVSKKMSSLLILELYFLYICMCGFNLEKGEKRNITFVFKLSLRIVLFHTYLCDYISVRRLYNFVVIKSPYSISYHILYLPEHTTLLTLLVFFLYRGHSC